MKGQILDLVSLTKTIVFVFFITPQFLNANTTPLVMAATNGDYDLVQQLLNQEDTDVNEQGDVGNTALIGASSNGHLSIVKLLLEQNDIDVNIKNNNGKNALIATVLQGHNDIISTLVNNNKTNVNAGDFFGNTALHYAIFESNVEVTKLILDNPQMDVNIQNDRGVTPLIAAASDKTTTSVLQLLIEVPAIDFELRDIASIDALLSACLARNIEAVRLLLPKVDVNAIDDQGKTALIHLSALGYLDVIQVLIQSIDLQLGIKDNTGNTALSLARYEDTIFAIIRHKNFDLLSLESQKNVLLPIIRNNNVNAMDALLRNTNLNFDEQVLNEAFALAVRSNNEELLKVFLFYKRDDILTNIPEDIVDDIISIYNQRNVGYEPLLKWSIAQEQKDLIAVLFTIDEFLTKSVLDANDATPLIWASAGGYTDIVKYLVSILPTPEINEQDSTGSSALITSIINDQIEVTNFLLDIREVDVSVKDKIGYTALAWASLTNKYTVVSRLLRGYRHNSFEASDIFTALMLATEEGHASVVREILQNSRRIESLSEYVDTTGMTPLMVAAENNHFVILGNLINFGYDDINHQDNLGNTALHLAVSNGSNEVVKSLLSFRNIDVNIQDYSTGATPLILALEQNNEKAALGILNHPSVDVDIKNSEGVHPMMLTNKFNNEEIVSLILQKSKN